MLIIQEKLSMITLKNSMKYLKIESNQGFYWDGNDYQEIGKINRDGLMFLLNAAENDNFEMDAYNESLLANKAHQIIYENIHSKLQDFLDEKDQFKIEVNNIYKDAISKYGIDDSVNFDDSVETTNGDLPESDIDPDDIPF